ncbi:HNH endonuclease family protein [Paraliomyxa miuraensis]|uniref:hypothetical protein n=1 Tax=Paraliomyxa miuraensis TaxID=376150 RepID=UPI0022524FA9|nr:hypothetical protein [Paraliomyxa miuraensis]MCX4246078.1 hypothetical protein [Paraliomyxa miuraensis]
MIRIHRTPEPPTLGPTRTERLTAARRARSKGCKLEFEGYGEVKENLFEMQHRKCCYCEKLEEQAKYRDVEHYRPKANYWWLAWTWENLLFACFECNREHKRDQFPLVDESACLTAEQAPPGNEQPLVLDPSDSNLDPLAEIEYRRDKVQGKERWVPYGRTLRGTRTIEVCGLDRPALLTRYSDHVNHVVRPKLEPLFRAEERGDTRAVVDAWSRAKRGLLHPAREFRALSHDVLLVLVPPSVRQRYHLSLDPT